MFKTLIAGVAALSLTITPLQAQEFDSDDFGKFLFGLIAAGVVASAISKQSDRTQEVVPQSIHRPDLPPAFNLNRAEPPVVQRHRDTGAPRLNPNGNRGWNNNGNAGWNHAPRQNAWVLPGHCFRSVKTRFGTQHMYGRQCLRNNYQHFAQLPRNCAVRVLSGQTARNGFDPLCLRREGYATPRG